MRVICQPFVSPSTRPSKGEYGQMGQRVAGSVMISVLFSATMSSRPRAPISSGDGLARRGRVLKTAARPRGGKFRGSSWFSHWFGPLPLYQIPLGSRTAKIRKRGRAFFLQAAMTLVIISFDVYGSRGNEQSIIRHQRGSSPTNACFQGLFVHIPPRNGGVTPDLRPPCRYSRNGDESSK